MDQQFPTFYVMLRTGISVSVPKYYAKGYMHFEDFMKGRGWMFTERLSNDYELSTTYSVNNRDINLSSTDWDIDLGEYQQDNLQKLILDLYKEKGYINNMGGATSICNTCDFSNSCYEGQEERKPDKINKEWSEIILPWIGKSYTKYKIAFLGINPNEDGGLFQAYKLIEEAKKEMLEGITKVNFGYVHASGVRIGKKYKGTFLWHRMAAYTKSIKSALSCDPDDLMKAYELNNIENFEPQKVANEFDSIVFLNHIKCSPLNERSKPSSKMWENCGGNVLLEELKILRPEYLILLGTGDNLWALIHHTLKEHNLSFSEYKEMKYINTTVLGFSTKIIAIPHPAAPAGGANTAYYKDIFDIVQILKQV